MRALGYVAMVVGALVVLGFLVGPFEISAHGASHDFEFVMVSGGGVAAGIGLIIGGLIVLRRGSSEKHAPVRR
jgi:hypothetical protein